MPRAPARRMGTWKLAYADFLTALVAFFLVMWLVKGVPDQGRENLAGYFRDGAISSDVTAAPTGVGPSGAAATLAQSLRDSELFRAENESLSIVAEGDRIRIDIADRSRDPVFETGSGEFTDSGRALATRLADLVGEISGSIEIEGHTDAFPYRASPGGNWDLSAARARAALEVLQVSGIDPARVRGVTGRAASVPRYPDEPHLPANRRVTIILQVAP